MSEKWTLPNGQQVIMFGSPEKIEHEKKIITFRYEYGQKYCKEKGWPTDFTKLSIAQVLEINEQPEWKDPLGEGVDRKELNITLDASGLRATDSDGKEVKLD